MTVQQVALDEGQQVTRPPYPQHPFTLLHGYRGINQVVGYRSSFHARRYNEVG